MRRFFLPAYFYAVFAYLRFNFEDGAVVVLLCFGSGAFGEL